MPAGYRTFTCLLSIGLSCGLFYLLGLHRMPMKMLGQHSQSIALMFLVLFSVLAVASLRSRFANAYSIVPICVGLSYFAAFAAYHLYFSIWETGRFLNTFSHTPIMDWFVTTMLFGPTVSLVWILGLSAGIFCLTLEWAVRRRMRGEV